MSEVGRKINFYKTLTPTQTVEQLKEDWNDPLFRKVAIATFNDAKYFISPDRLSTAVMGKEAREEEGQTLTEESELWLVLDLLSSGTLRGKEAEATLAEACVPLRFRDALVVLQILDKTWRNGVTVNTINQAVPGTFRPVSLMLAHKYYDRLEADRKLTAKGKPTKYIKWPLLATVKYDGFRAAFNPETQQALSRNGNPFPLQTKLRETLALTCIQVQQSFNLPQLPALDVELFSGSWKETAEARAAHRGYGTAIAFGMMPIDGIYGGNSEPYEVRRLFQALQDRCSSYPASPVRYPEWREVWSEEDVDAYFKEVLEAGHEGLILRPLVHPYEGKRSYHWLKVKAEETEDLPVTGWEMADPRSKYAGLIGAVEVDREGIRSKICGMSDKLRKELTEMGDEIKKLTVEAKYHELTPDGKLRHGVIKRVRFDK